MMSGRARIGEAARAVQTGNAAPAQPSLAPPAPVTPGLLDGTLQGGDPSSMATSARNAHASGFSLGGMGVDTQG